MQVEKLTIPKKEAKEQLEALKETFKQNYKLRKQELYYDMRKVYGHLTHGGKIIDLFATFKEIGVNENRNPKLAICRADSNYCYCYKDPIGSAVFSIENTDTARKSKLDVYLPADTFQWLPENETHLSWDLRRIKTVVPIIPPKILLKEIKVLLRNFHILWEVEKGAWKKERPPRDPILLRKLTPNLYGVLATWNLTKLERAIIRGRIK